MKTKQDRINAGYLRLLRAILKGRSPEPDGEVHRPRSAVRSRSRPRSLSPRASNLPAALGYLARFLCVGLALALLASGCATRPLKGGKAVITRKPSGSVEQTLQQGENAAQATKQDQETIKVRSYTLPAATRIEQTPVAGGVMTGDCGPGKRNIQHPTSNIQHPMNGRGVDCGYQTQDSGLQTQDSTTYVLSAPMPVIEREETRAKTELGAAQKDTARELGAKLASLKGIVWVGVGLFVFGLASLVYPPLKVIVASVTTSAALMLGGVALMVLPTMVVGNELLILGVVGLVVGAWFLAHRHGQLSGLVAATTASAPTSAPAASPGAKTVSSKQ
jgi:hypothetical protein